MGELMIRRPKTGKPVTTGIHIERARFRSMPVFFSSSFCPACGRSQSGLRGTHGSAIHSRRPVTRIAIGSPSAHARASAYLSQITTRVGTVDGGTP
jgi:hypothetical protein